MLINIVFLTLYVLFSGFLSGIELYYMLSIHLIIYLTDSFRKKIPASPITLFAAGTIIVNIGNIGLINQVQTRTVTTYDYIVPMYIDDAALIWCISCTLIIMGFSMINKKIFPSISFDIPARYLKNIFFFLIGINLLVVFAGVSLRGSLKVFGLLNAIGILFYARLWGKTDDKAYRKYAILLLLIETYVALTHSFLRFELIFPTMCLFIGYFIGKGSVKYLLSYRILPYIVIGIVYASVFSSLQSNRSNFISVFYDSEDTNTKDAEPQTKNADALMIRSANLAQITNVVKLVHENGFYNGTASAPLLIAMIPRALWPEKPTIQLGAWFALAIGKAYQNEDGNINNSINMTVSGELYLDFGWFGVAIGSVLLGVFLALLWQATQFYSSEYNLIGTIFGGYLFVIMFIGIAADLQIVISLFSLYISFFIIKRLLKSML